MKRNKNIKVFNSFKINDNGMPVTAMWVQCIAVVAIIKLQ